MSVPDEWVDIAYKAYVCAESDHSDEAPVPMAVVLAAVAPLIRAAEREACARVCEAWADEVEAKAPQSPTIIQARNHAAAIRALDT